MSLHKEIWETLSKKDLEGRVKEKMKGLNYLPWASAWEILMDHYPASDYTYGAITTHADNTATVEVTVTIVSNASRKEYVSRTERLPVLNGNKAAVNPDAFAINTAYKRCLVKCLAHFGLGIYIYEGEDMPQYDTDETKDLIMALLGKMDDEAQARFWAKCGSDNLEEVPQAKLRPALKWLKGVAA